MSLYRLSMNCIDLFIEHAGRREAKAIVTYRYYSRLVTDGPEFTNPNQILCACYEKQAAVTSVCITVK